MEENQNKNSLKKLLDRLQENSWQLELLVSGFAIFGLLNALNPLGDAFTKALNEDHILKDFYQAVYAAVLILIFNLILLVVLRSLWIGALGLRYVSGEIKIERLNYSERFTNYLNKKVGSSDQYIQKLEKLCCVIFAISFLLIFYVFATIIVQYSINFIASFRTDDPSILLNIIQYAIVIFLFLGAILTFFDYLTLGLLKKNKWIAMFYFPFYWIFSYLTLSFLYRPLFYNLIDNKFGRRVSILLLPLYLTILFISNMYKEQSGFVSFNSVKSSAIRANSSNYEDLVEKDKLYIASIAIQSKVITDPYIEVKIPLSATVEKNILDFNKSLKQYQDKHLYKSYIDFFGKSIKSTFTGNTDSLHLEFMKTFQKVYTIQIDSIPCKSDFIITKEDDNMNLSIGFETYIGTNNLTEGKHVLVYSRYKHPDTDSVIVIKEIPFWYYKE